MTTPDDDLREAERAWAAQPNEQTAEALVHARMRAGVGLTLVQQLDLLVMVSRLTKIARRIQNGSEKLIEPVTWEERARATSGPPPPHQCVRDPLWRPHTRAQGRGGETIRWSQRCLHQPCPANRYWVAENEPPRGVTHQHVPWHFREPDMLYTCAYPGCRALCRIELLGDRRSDTWTEPTEA